MKKIYKIMVFVMMLALAIGSVIAAPITVLAVAPACVGATLALTKMPTTGTVNTEIVIPRGTTTTAGSEVTVKVTDPHGTEVALADVDDGYKFTATKVGTYKATYTASAVGTTVSKTEEVFLIKVTGSKVSMNIPENSPFMLPSKVGKDTTLVLPYPNVVIDDEEFPGQYKDDTDADSVVVDVKVTDPKFHTWNNPVDANWNEELSPWPGYTNPLGVKVVDGKTYYTFKASKDSENETIYGTYTILYKFVSTQTGEVTTKTFKVQVASNYSVENQKVTFTWNGSLPESAVLGNEVELPKPVTVDANNNSASVNTYTKITVEYHNGENVEEVPVEDFKFTPMKETVDGSYYTLTYRIFTLEQLDLANSSYTTLDQATDAEVNAKAEAALTKVYTLKNVKDTVAPVPQVVNAYAVEEDGSLSQATIDELEDVDVNYVIPSKARTGVEIEIPAIYATDNFSPYKDLTLSRTLIDEDGNTISINGSEIINGDEESTLPKVIQAKANETAKVLFRLKGKYTVRYRVTDKANKQKDISYTIVVTDNLEDIKSPVITLPSIVQNIKSGDELTFAEPTVVDYKTDSSSTEVIDERVSKNVYYYYTNSIENMPTDFSTVDKTELKADKETSKYTLKVETNQSYLIVVFRAEDDAKYSVGATDNNVSWEYKAVRVFGVEDGEIPQLVATDLEAIAAELNGHGQGEKLTLGSFTFQDEDDNSVNTSEYLTASVKVLDKNGNSVNVTGVKFNYDNSKFTISNGKFVTTVAGRYQVVISVTDLGGNTLVNSLEFEVEDTKAPVVEVEHVEETMELGKTYVLPTPVIVDDGEKVDNKATTLVEFGNDNPRYEFRQRTMEFKPLEKGTYTFRFLGKDAAENAAYSDWYTVTVSDTIQPEIVLNETDEYIMPEIAPYKENNEVVNVNLPLFTVVDEYNSEIEMSGVTVSKSGDDVPVYKKNDDPTDDETYEGKDEPNATHYEFTPTGNGIYTVTYKAVDLAGNSSTKTFEIKVGDVTAPTITVDSKNIPGSYKIGETMSIDLTKLSTVDDVDGTTQGKDALEDNKLTVTLTKPDGTTVTATVEDDKDIWTYEFETAGSYTLKYSATDKAGNTGDDVVYNFEVKSTSNKASISEKAWGVVLIVVSVALLAGVVVYFIKTKDTPDALDKKNKESK